MVGVDVRFVRTTIRKLPVRSRPQPGARPAARRHSVYSSPARHPPELTAHCSPITRASENRVLIVAVAPCVLASPVLRVRGLPVTNMGKARNNRFLISQRYKTTESATITAPALTVSVVADGVAGRAPSVKSALPW